MFENMSKACMHYICYEQYHKFKSTGQIERKIQWLLFVRCIVSTAIGESVASIVFI